VWVVLTVGLARAANAQTTWVQDEQVLARHRVRLTLGYGHAFSRISAVGVTPARYVDGSGMSFEEALGLGRELEVGARFGVRLDRNGRAVRADELGRGFDTETFGTGLSMTANPELRGRWRFFASNWAEMGLEDRVILPIVPDPSFTDVAGAWAVFHPSRWARFDVALNGIVRWDSFAFGSSVETGLGFPVRAWVNATQHLFAGALFTVHSFSGAKYARAYSRWIAGVGAGCRLGEWDVLGLVESQDLAEGPLMRSGYGLAISWHP
jgi:hypothetical protein